jgi:UDP-N-acetylmuramoyl-L-alanyl-D-glutamate--2,6-diaminopimelate ligase
MLPRPKLEGKNLKDFDGKLFNQELHISGVSINAQAIKPGDLFIALSGAKTHGLNFVSEAIKNGAAAVLADKPADISIPLFVSENARSLVGRISAWYNDNPFSKLVAVGVTGTNGKTTTVNLVKQMWQSAGKSTGIIGTIGTEIDGISFPGIRTTPEACDLQAIAALMVQRNVTHLAMEVSSHALVQERLSGAFFKIAAFSNLTQDHLDFHGSMENYFLAKSKLFNADLSQSAVINIDDKYGIKLYEKDQNKAVSVSRLNNSGDWHFEKIDGKNNGFDVVITNNNKDQINAFFPLLGEHNLDNLILAAAIAAESGLTVSEIAAAIPKLQSVAGRLEQINLGQSFNALVDYAHTPDAVERVLISAKGFTTGKVIGILGCGGERDKGKRPLMGKALIDHSDIAIFTSDNPRSESPDQIISEMVGNLEITSPNSIISDRRAAIDYAVSIANSGDSILLLGKGHEVGQEISGVVTPFNDVTELSDAISKVVSK